MGMFFDEEKTKHESTIKNGEQNGFFATIIIMILAFCLGILSLIIKPILKWLFDFDEHGKVKIGIIAIIVVVVGLSLYRIPSIRDYISLSNTHTLNYSNYYNSRIQFPDRSLFYSDVSNHVINNHSFKGKRFITYVESDITLAQQDECYLVPRTKKIVFSSRAAPVQVEGFEDTVEYVVILSVIELTLPHYFLELLMHPSYLFKDVKELQYTITKRPKDTSWREFVSNWDKVSKVDHYGIFEMKALSKENAIICF